MVHPWFKIYSIPVLIGQPTIFQLAMCLGFGRNVRTLPEYLFHSNGIGIILIDGLH